MMGKEQKDEEGCAGMLDEDEAEKKTARRKTDRDIKNKNNFKKRSKKKHKKIVGNSHGRRTGGSGK